MVNPYFCINFYEQGYDVTAVTLLSLNIPTNLHQFATSLQKLSLKAEPLPRGTTQVKEYIYTCCLLTGEARNPSSRSELLLKSYSLSNKNLKNLNLLILNSLNNDCTSAAAAAAAATQQWQQQQQK